MKVVDVKGSEVEVVAFKNPPKEVTAGYTGVLQDSEGIYLSGKDNMDDTQVYRLLVPASEKRKNSAPSGQGMAAAVNCTSFVSKVHNTAAIIGGFVAQEVLVALAPSAWCSLAEVNQHNAAALADGNSCFVACRDTRESTEKIQK